MGAITNRAVGRAVVGYTLLIHKHTLAEHGRIPTNNDTTKTETKTEIKTELVPELIPEFFQPARISMVFIMFLLYQGHPFFGPIAIQWAIIE